MPTTDKPRWQVAAGTVAIVAILLFLRRSDALIRPQLWAEDATVFFLNAYEEGPKCLVESYAGYLQLLPRIVALVAVAFDPRWTPAIFNAAAAAVHLSVAAAIFSRRIDLPAKPVLALLLVAIPHTGEVMLNLTNVQWLLGVGLVLILLTSDPATVSQRMVDWLVAAIGGLTGPFVVFLLPLFVVRFALRRTRDSATLAVLAGLASAVQLIFMFRGRALFLRRTPPDLMATVSVMSARLYGTFWGGYKMGQFVVGANWFVVGAALTTALLFVAVRPGPWAYSRRMIAGAWICMAMPVGAKFLREAVVISAPINGDRYFFIPHVLLGWLIVIEGARRAGWRRFAAAGVLACALIANMRSFMVPALRDYQWGERVEPIREGRAFVIPVNPEGWMLTSQGRNPGSRPPPAAGGRPQ